MRYCARRRLIARNKALMAALGSAARANGADDALNQFRTLSGTFQKGQVTSMAYFTQFRSLFGEDATSTYFPEVAPAHRHALCRVRALPRPRSAAPPLSRPCCVGRAVPPPLCRPHCAARTVPPPLSAARSAASPRCGTCRSRAAHPLAARPDEARGARAHLRSVRPLAAAPPGTPRTGAAPPGRGRRGAAVERGRRRCVCRAHRGWRDVGVWWPPRSLIKRGVAGSLWALRFSTGPLVVQMRYCGLCGPLS
jgi:hypothetical protein